MTLRPIALLLLVAPVVADACRCAPLELSRYFEQAAFVGMGRLVHATDLDDRRELEFELLAAPHKGGDRAQRRGTSIRFATAMSTASCGLQPQLDAVYVVFAQRHDDPSDDLWIDTCNGTRALLARDGTPVDFADVPARFIPGQLNALQGMDVLRNVSARAPNEGDSGNESLVGLLDLKALAHGGNVRLFCQPRSDASLIRTVASYDALESREYDYELAGAVVYAKIGGWYRVRTTGGTYGWVAPDEAGTYFPYRELPVRRLAYLTKDWSGLSWQGPGTGIPSRTERGPERQVREYPVNVLDSTDIAGLPWFRVEILETDPCSGDEAKPGRVGWVPGYGQQGRPNVWFYSRGC